MHVVLVHHPATAAVKPLNHRSTAPPSSAPPVLLAAICAVASRISDGVAMTKDQISKANRPPIYGVQGYINMQKDI